MDKSKVMLFIIIGLLVALIGTVIGVTIFLTGMVGDTDPEDFHEHTQLPVVAHMGIMETEVVSLGADILTNLAIDTDGRQGIVRTSIVVGIAHGDDEAEFNAFLAGFNSRTEIARNVAIDVFGGLTFNEVNSPEGRRAAEEEIRIRLQGTFESNLIVNVSTSNWFVQNPR